MNDQNIFINLQKKKTKTDKIKHNKFELLGELASQQME